MQGFVVLPFGSGHKQGVELFLGKTLCKSDLRECQQHEDLNAFHPRKLEKRGLNIRR